MRTLAALLLALATPGVAQTPPAPAAIVADPALNARADELVAILAKKGDAAAFFAPSLLQLVRYDQMVPLFDQLIQTLGQPIRVETLTPASATAARLMIRYERGTVQAQLSIDPAAPHLVNGFRITGTTVTDDSLAKLDADTAALPGEVVYGVYALGEGPPRPVVERGGDTKAPLGSAFKLWVLDALAAEVAAGRRSWATVIPTGTPSLPSGMLQAWPRGTPMTLQALATLMISISDNTATDTLVHHLGHTIVDAAAARSGGSVPVLTTREAFALKADPHLRAGWLAATPAAKRAFLASHAAEIEAKTLDVAMFGAVPLAIDSVEWFASPRGMAALLDRLRKRPAPVRQILAVNRGVDPVTAERYAYVGFKGGSEPGVIALDFLVQTKDGRWYAASGSWRRPDGAIDELKFLALMTRAMALAAR